MVNSSLGPSSNRAISGRVSMPKYLIAASYSGEGLQGLRKDKATARRQAITTAIESLGGRLECEYFALGEHDVYLIADLPDTVSAAALVSRHPQSDSSAPARPR